MIVDCHSHVMWYPDHVSPEVMQDAAQAWQANMGLAAETFDRTLPPQDLFDARPERHWAASAGADRVVVFGMQAPATGFDIPNEVVADYVRQHPDKLEGWASVDPNRPDCVEQLEHCVQTLGLKGLKLAPAYQCFDPMDTSHHPLYRKCQDLGLPILWHQGTTFPRKARICWSLPLQLEDIALAFPDLNDPGPPGPSLGGRHDCAHSQGAQPLCRYFRGLYRIVDSQTFVLQLPRERGPD